MNFSKEQIEKAKTASSAEELLEMARADGIELSTEQAETYFSFLTKAGQLSDEEMQQVAGGKRYENLMECSNCGHKEIWALPCKNVACPVCGQPTFSVK